MTDIILKRIPNLGFLARSWQKLKTAWTKHRAFVEARDELEKLDNRTLADIGIRRCEIKRVAREHAEKVVVNDNLKGWV